MQSPCHRRRGFWALFKKRRLLALQRHLKASWCCGETKAVWLRQETNRMRAKTQNVQRMRLGCGDVSACAPRVSKTRCVRDVSGVSAPFIGVCPVFSCVSALFGTVCPRCVPRVSGCVRMCPRRVGACPNVTRMRAKPNASQNTARPGTSAVETVINQFIIEGPHLVGVRG